ncbi:MAG TPA: type II toxin-antitoxin system prevent-host-death family antitoxin [Caulobacteraceae bacterium]|nr:type II toxin-antitoxin system prevent-host-death family antitoxin [Caulobacteraceae bacterium]
MGEMVPIAEVKKNFELYQDRALRTPVTVTSHGRPSVVILAADEYERLRSLDRQALSITELSEADIAAIAAARIPEDKRYRTDDLR